MPKGTNTPIHIQQEILLRFDSYRRQELSIMDACARISNDLVQEHNYAIPPKSVWAMLNRLRPTTDLAKMYLKHKAMKLAKRIVAKASPSEAIDILSRPGMDVLSPASKGVEGGGMGGFFLTVQSDTCGAVKVGAMIGPAPVKQLDEATFDPFAGAVGGFDAEVHTENRPIPAHSITESRESVLARARAKVREAQTRVDSGHGGVQGADGDAEA